MKTSATRLIMLTLLAGSLAVTSCKKKEEPAEPPKIDSEQASAADNNIAELIAADIGNIGSQASEDASLSTYRSAGPTLEMAPCATIAVNLTNKEITVDFGSGCMCLDGNFRSGLLKFNFSTSSANANYYRNPGFRMVVTAQNYVVNSYSVQVTSKTIANITPVSLPPGTNPGMPLTWSVTADISIAKPSNGGTIVWKCNRQHELVNTPDSSCYRGQSKSIVWKNALIRVNGTASGTNAGGENYTVQATNLERDFKCAPYAQRPHWHPYIKGTLVYTPGTRPARTIDYGNGSCDGSATITISGVSYAFTLL